MGQTQNPSPCTPNMITQGYHPIRNHSRHTLSTQINLFQRGKELLSHSCSPLDSKSSSLLLENSRYYTQRNSLIHPHLIILYFHDFTQLKSGISVKGSLEKYGTSGSEASRTNVNTLCSLNLFEQNCKRSLIPNTNQASLMLHLYHEYMNHTLQSEIQSRKRREEHFREKQLWTLMAHAVSAGRVLVESGFKEPLLSPNSIKVDSRGNFKVGEWEFTHFYEELEEDEEETYFYEQGETFLKPASSRIQCQNQRFKQKKSFNILTNYYWAPQGTSGMQNIITLGHKQQQYSTKRVNNQIFSLGMTLLHICLMRPLYQSDTFSEKKIKTYLKQAAAARTAQGLELSATFIQTLEKMLAWDPQDRTSYEQLEHQITNQRSIFTAVSILTTENDEPSSGTFREKKIQPAKSIIFREVKGSGSICQGFGDIDHPLEQSRRLNIPCTLRNETLNYQKIDVTIKRQRREWERFQNRIEESSYKVKQNPLCSRQLFPPVSMFTFPAQVMLQDEEDSPNRQSLCNYNTTTNLERQNIDFEFEPGCDVGGSSIENSIKLLDISNIKAQDDTKEVSKQKNSFIKLDVPEVEEEEESFANFFNGKKNNSEVVREDSLLLKSSIAPIPPQQIDKQEDLFTPPELLALIRSSAYSGQSRTSNKSSKNINTQQNQHPLIVSEQVEAQLCNSIFVKESFAKGYYEGGKVDGLRNGYGTFYYNQGGKYCGDWQNNQMHGKGTLYYADGRIAYQGDWSHDSLCGKGILYNQNSIKLVKSYDYSCFDQSEECWVYYEGSFHNDDKWGKGTLLLSNGQKYEGNFRNDLVDGRGNFYTLGGQKIIGQWKANQLIKVIKQESQFKEDNQCE